MTFLILGAVWVAVSFGLGALWALRGLSQPASEIDDWEGR